MKTLAIVVVFWLSCQLAYCQLESTWWYFGYGAGLSFESGTAIADTSSNFLSGNGAATQSNSDGELLFYYGQNTIWNRQHQVMLNGGGLFNANAEHGAAIVPRPNKDHQYYVFNTDAGSFVGGGVDVGLFYHLVDMTQDNGMGAVVDSVKNVVLFDSTAERIAATPHANGVDYWVVVHQCGSENMLSVLVTEDGPQLPAVVSSIAVQTSSSMHCDGGGLRFNHRNNKLAHVTGPYSQIFDFDASTGHISNPIDIPFTGGDGVEFSPDDSKLYLSGPIQIDLSNYNQAAIVASMLDLSVPNIVMAGMQLGLDGRLYGTAYNLVLMGAPYMAAIEFPNQAGAVCDYNDSAVYLDDRFGESSVPVFLSSYIKTDFLADDLCSGDTTFFDINFHFIDSVLWDFGDPASGAANTSTLVDAFHIYDDPGTYTVTLIAQNGAVTDTVVKTITIQEAPNIDLGPDVEFCSLGGNTLTLSLDGKEGDYLWSDSSTDSTLLVAQSGSYALTFTDACGSDSDSVFISVALPPTVSLLNDTSICEDSLLLIPSIENSTPFTNYKWDSGVINNPIYAIRTSSGLHANSYSITVSNACGFDSTQSTITFLPVPDGVLPNDSVYCLDDPFFLLNSQSDGINYLWNNGSSGPDLRLAESGTYWLLSSSTCDTLIDSFKVVFNGEPKVDIGNDTFICAQTPITLFNRVPRADLKGTQSYLWSDGSTDSTLALDLDSSRYITVRATYADCSVSDSIRITVKADCPERCKPALANIITPNGDGINDRFIIEMECEPTNLELSIYNRWGQLVYQNTAVNNINSWDGSINGERAADGTYFYVLSFQDEDQVERVFQGTLNLVR